MDYSPNLNHTIAPLYHQEQFGKGALRSLTNQYGDHHNDSDQREELSPQSTSKHIIIDDNFEEFEDIRTNLANYKSVTKDGRVKKKGVLNSGNRNTLNSLNKMHKFKPTSKPVGSKYHAKQYSSVMSGVEPDSLIIKTAEDSGRPSKVGKKSTLGRDPSKYHLANLPSTNSKEQLDVSHTQNGANSSRTPVKQSNGLADEVLELMKINAELDIINKQADLQFQSELQELQLGFEDAESSLVNAMQDYVQVEEDVCDLESHDINVHKAVHDMMREYQQIYEEIQREKLTDPVTIENLCNIEKEIQLENFEYQKLLAEKELKTKHLREYMNETERELKHTIDNQINIQILNEKPYFTIIAVELDRKPAKSSESIEAQNHYFETVELFTGLKISEKEYTFSKVLRNEEIDYFTPPHLRHQLSYREELAKYLIEYLSQVIQFVRRIQRQNNFYKGSFKNKKPEEELKKELEMNEMNRKLTIMFLAVDQFLLAQVLEGLSGIIGDNLEDVQIMIDHLLSPIGLGGINRVNLLTPNLDGS